MTEAEMEAEIAAEMRARGLNPNDASDRKVFAAETDAIMTEHMRSLGFDPSNPAHKAEFVRLLESGALPWPGEALSLH